MNWLIIVAGGCGERMNLPMNKIFAKLGKFPLLYWTLKTFEDTKTVDNIVISAKSEDIKKIKAIIKKNRFKKVRDIVKASSSRQNSTFLVLKTLKSKIKNSDLVGVHNAVNPFVAKDEIEKVYASAKKFKAALLAYPAKDTVKITNGKGIVDQTPLRTSCWYAQTPQVATFQHLWKAFSKAEKDNFIGTDDTQLLERIKVKAKIVPCSNRNIKITFPEDLIVAKQILKDFKNQNA